MAYSNGDIPRSALVSVQSGLYLTPLAAASWRNVVAGVQRDYGWTPVITDAFRSLSEQVRIFVDRYDVQATGGGYWGDVRHWKGVRYVRRHYRKSDGKVAAAAAVPGTSNHGNGTAVDVSGLGAFGSTRFNQFAAVATRNGWSIAEGKSVNEPWHWTKNSLSYINNPIQNVGSVPTVPGIDPIDPIEDDMTPDQAAQLTQVVNQVNNLYAGHYIGGPSSPFGRPLMDVVAEIHNNVNGVPQVLEQARKEIAVVPNRVWWEVTVDRGEQKVPVIQEVADNKTLAELIVALLRSGTLADVDEAALAAAMAPVLASSVRALSDDDFDRIKKDVNDENDRRARERLDKQV
jgi:hypothetical protein